MFKVEVVVHVHSGNNHSRSFEDVLDDTKPFGVDGSRTRVFGDGRRTHVVVELNACVTRVFVDGSGTLVGEGLDASNVFGATATF